MTASNEGPKEGSDGNKEEETSDPHEHNLGRRTGSYK
jgi:hypothetical protein